MVRAAVSGSFHRHMDAITAAVHDLAALGVRVLSPADPRIVAQQGEFLFVASDRVRSVRLVQDRHLESIRAANFLWLVCPDGYVGQSASMELGYAAAARIPIFAAQAPTDLTLREYVKIVPNLAAALSVTKTLSQSPRREGILINPHATVEQVHCTLDRIDTALARVGCSQEPGHVVHREIQSLQASLALPTYMH